MAEAEGMMGSQGGAGRATMRPLSGPPANPWIASQLVRTIPGTSHVRVQLSKSVKLLHCAQCWLTFKCRPECASERCQCPAKDLL